MAHPSEPTPDLLVPSSLPAVLRAASWTQTLAAGELLFQQGDRADATFVLMSGRVRLARYGPDDRLVTLQWARAGDSFAELAPIQPAHTCNAIADSDVALVVYPVTALRQALRESPALADSYLRQLARYVAGVELRLELHDVRPARDRVWRYLQFLAGDSSEIALDGSLRDLAEDIGFTPETLSRALSRLEREGKIARLPGAIQLRTVA